MYYPNPEQFKGMSGYVIDGVWYPRVTKIVDIKSKPALYRFYGEALNFQHGEEIKQKSAAEGTLIHETVEKILMGENPEIPELIRPSIEAFQNLIDVRRIQVDRDYIEKRVVNYDERYAGTIDSLALIDGKFGVLDIKTSYNIFRDYNLQTSAYIAALQSKIRELQTRWILRIDQVKTCLLCSATLRQKGGRDKIRLPFSNNSGGLTNAKQCPHQWSELKGEVELREFPYWQNDYEAFLGAKKLWEWENEYVLKQIGYL